MFVKRQIDRLLIQQKLTAAGEHRHSAVVAPHRFDVHKRGQLIDGDIALVFQIGGRNIRGATLRNLVVDIRDCLELCIGRINGGRNVPLGFKAHTLKLLAHGIELRGKIRR